MEKTINGTKYQFKENLSAREAADVDLFNMIMPIVIGELDEKEKDKKLMQLAFSKPFQERGVKLIHYMMVNPKKSLDEVWDMDYELQAGLTLELLKYYIKSLEKIGTIVEKKLTDFGIEKVVRTFMMTMGNETWESVDDVPFVTSLETMIIYFTFIKEALIPQVNPALINHEEDDYDFSQFVKNHEKSLEEEKKK